MALPVFTHPACLAHDTGPDHPETTARLSTVLALFRSDPAFDVRDAAPADLEPILRVHPQPYLDAVKAFSLAGGGALTGDTTLSAQSWDAALGAAGAVLAATGLAMQQGSHAFAAVRPPGHHALRDTAMGFCLVNNVVVAAYAALAAGRARVLIIDWDVHHGNGTQALVEHDARIRFVSLHQHPWYPGTGLANERGVGNVFNVPRGPGRPPDWYVEDLWEAMVAATKNWTPGHRIRLRRVRCHARRPAWRLHPRTGPLRPADAAPARVAARPADRRPHGGRLYSRPTRRGRRSTLPRPGLKVFPPLRSEARP